MANERLRAAIHEAGFGPEDLAEALGNDRKTVDRWIDGYVPYRRNQHLVAKLLAVDPGYLWPPASAEQSRDLGMAELVSLWANSSSSTKHPWRAPSPSTS